MKNICKIFIFLLFIMTNLAWGEDKPENDDNSIKWLTGGILYDFLYGEETERLLREHFSIQLSGGMTDVYGSMHNLTPIHFDSSLGHAAIGVGLFNVPVIRHGNSATLCLDANISHGSVAELAEDDIRRNFSDPNSELIDFNNKSETTYSVGLTYKIYPFRESGKIECNM